MGETTNVSVGLISLTENLMMAADGGMDGLCCLVTPYDELTP